jgi:hypothetical protein
MRQTARIHQGQPAFQRSNNRIALRNVRRLRSSQRIDAEFGADDRTVREQMLIKGAFDGSTFLCLYLVLD